MKYEAKGETRQRESWGGFHFFSLYRNCARKFFIRYLLNIETAFTSQALVQGGAFHSGKATWYKKRTQKAALEEVNRYIEEAWPEMDDESYDWVISRTPEMLQKWIEDFGKRDLKQYKILLIEDEIVALVPGTDGFYVTMRPDTVLQDKQWGYTYIMETKTTGFSLPQAEKGVYYGDQATMYIWGVSHIKHLEVDGVLSDVCYWHKKSKDPSKITCLRGDIITRTPEDLDSFIRGAASTINEIAQKVAAWNEGVNEDDLFPHSTDRCMDFFRPCEYADICRSRLCRESRLPPNLRHGTPIELIITKEDAP